MSETRRQLAWIPVAIGVLVPTFAAAAECNAVKAMETGLADLNARRSDIQRREWLLLEHLSSDRNSASQATFQKEVETSAARSKEMLAINADVAALPADTPSMPEAYSAACKVLTRLYETSDGMVKTRTAELDAFYDKRYPFLKGCDRIAATLVNYAHAARKPETTPKVLQLTRLTFPLMLGPPMSWSHVQTADMDRMAEQAVLAPEVPDRARHAYFALQCLNIYRGRARPFPEVQAVAPALAKCDSEHWTTVGMCVSSAVGGP